MGYHPEMKHNNWEPEKGTRVVMLDLVQTQVNSTYAPLIGKVGTVISSRRVEASDHSFILAEFDDYGKEEMYSWRLAPYKILPNWEV